MDLKKLAKKTVGCSCATCLQVFKKLYNEPSFQRSMELFFSLLTEEQKKGFEEDFTLTEKGGVSGTTYELSFGYSLNILRGNRAMCYHLRHQVPIWDHMIAQLLHIRYAESTLLAGARS